MNTHNDDALADLWATGNLIPRTPLSEALATEAFATLEDFEARTGARKRDRKAADRDTAREMVRRLTSEAAYRYLSKADGNVAVPLGKSVLGRPSRYTGPIFSKQLPAVLARLADPSLGWLAFEKGTYGSGMGKTSTFRAGPALIKFIEEHTVSFADITRDPGEEIVILKGTSKSRKPSDWINYADTAETVRLRSDLRELNDFIESQDVDLIDPSQMGRVFLHGDGSVIDTDKVRMRRYFNRESLQLGGRMFGGWWQTLPKIHRCFIRVQGERVADMDYAGMCINTLYAMIGKQAPARDPYALEGLQDHRDGCKQFMAAMLHKDKPPRRLPAGTAKLLPDGMTAERMLALMEANHAPIMGMLFPGQGQPCVGLELMRLESDIILRVLLDLKDHGIAGLNMHDGAMVPESAAPLTEVLMIHHAWYVAKAVLRVVRKDIPRVSVKQAA